MARSNMVITTAAMVSAFAAGLLLGQNIDRGDTELRDSAGNALVAPQPRRTAATPPQGFQTIRDEDAPRAIATQSSRFGYDRLTYDTGGDVAKACVQFNAPLDDTGDTVYADYVRIEPATPIAVSVDGVSLCLSGLEFNKEYRATLRRGLPNASGDTLIGPERVTIAFGDKPAFIGFAGEGVILPRLDADGVGILSVNVEKIKVSVYRVSDRALALKSISEGEALRPEDYYYVYDEENGEAVGVKVFDKEIEIDGKRNETTTSVFPLGAALTDLSPGAYFVRLDDASDGVQGRRIAKAWRWLLYTDMALTTYSSEEGIDVAVRSISTGRPRGNVDLQLVATNNDILARSSTSADGFARFDRAAVAGEGPRKARMIFAYGPQFDFSVIDLREQLEKIFEPFYTSRAKGTGLGLAVVRAIAEAHQGEVWVKSIVGYGSQFGLRLPLTRKEENE